MTIPYLSTDKMVVWNKARGKGESLFGKKVFCPPSYPGRTEAEQSEG
jgi:hypothetical protein